jgi:nitrite reductase/ring-hydroxylating ferredoxin subunit
MGEWVEVAELAQLKRRKKLVVSAGEQEIALFYVDGEVFALNDVCIHKERRLSKGLIFQGHVVCPGHQWAFDLRTGWVDEWARCQPVYRVKVESEAVYVDPEPVVRAAAPEAHERYASGG